MTDNIHTNIKAMWDMQTADTCRLPELIPNICERCRDIKYCQRQLTLEDMLKDGGTHDSNNGPRSSDVLRGLSLRTHGRDKILPSNTEV